MPVRRMHAEDREALAQMIAAFREELSQLRGRGREPDLDAARKELSEYGAVGYPIFVAESPGGELTGYLVCRVDRDVVWAESLFVRTEHRRRGVGSELYEAAERLAEELGGETTYNWVHPNNDAMIGLLRKRGYGVLNLIELRRPRGGERPAGKIRVGDQEFDY